GSRGILAKRLFTQARFHKKLVPIGKPQNAQTGNRRDQTWRRRRFILSACRICRSAPRHCQLSCMSGHFFQQNFVQESFQRRYFRIRQFHFFLQRRKKSHQLCAFEQISRRLQITLCHCANSQASFAASTPHDRQFFSGLQRRATFRDALFQNFCVCCQRSPFVLQKCS